MITLAAVAEELGYPVWTVRRAAYAVGVEPSGSGVTLMLTETEAGNVRTLLGTCPSCGGKKPQGHRRGQAAYSCVGVKLSLKEIGRLDEAGLEQVTAVLRAEGWSEAGLGRLRERAFWIARAANSELERRRLRRRRLNGDGR